MPKFKLTRFNDAPKPRLRLTKNPADAGKKKLKPRHAKKAQGEFGMMFIPNAPPEEPKG